MSPFSVQLESIARMREHSWCQKRANLGAQRGNAWHSEAVLALARTREIVPTWQRLARPGTTAGHAKKAGDLGFEPSREIAVFALFLGVFWRSSNIACPNRANFLAQMVTCHGLGPPLLYI